MFDSITTVIFDLDGTLYCGDSPVHNAAYTVNQLRKSKTQVLFLTNNSVKTREQIKDKLQSMNIPCSVDEIFTSGYMAVLYAQNKKLTDIYICGSDGLKKEFENAGFIHTDTEYAKNIIIGYNPDFSYKKLTEAFSVALNADYIIACNKERSFPGNDNKLFPGCGAMVAPIEFCTNRTVDVVVGKPYPQILDLVCQKYNLKPNQVLMIGDTYESDISMAKQFGCYSAYFNSNPDKTKYPSDIYITELSQLCTYFHIKEK